MKHKILLVDDDPGVRRMLSRVLEEEDYAVVPAANGLEAIELAASRTPDLVLRKTCVGAEGKRLSPNGKMTRLTTRAAVVFRPNIKLASRRGRAKMRR